jgi:hypothetical protein
MGSGSDQPLKLPKMDTDFAASWAGQRKVVTMRGGGSGTTGTAVGREEALESVTAATGIDSKGLEMLKGIDAGARAVFFRGWWR